MRTSKNEIHLSGDGNDRKRKKERRGEKGPNNVSTTVEMTQTVGREKPMIASRVVGVLGWADDEEAGVSGGESGSNSSESNNNVLRTTVFVIKTSIQVWLVFSHPGGKNLSVRIASNGFFEFLSFLC